MAYGVNLVRYSSNLTAPLWKPTRVSLADLAGTTTSPTGRGTRFIVSDNSGGWTLIQNQIPEYEPNTRFTLSCWIAQESFPSVSIGLWLIIPGSKNVQAFFNPTTWVVPTATVAGTAPTFSDPLAGIESLPNSWKRIWIHGTTPPTTGLNLNIQFGQSSVVPNGSSLLLGGFSLYQGDLYEFVETTTTPQGNLFLETFPTTYHTTENRYPANSSVIQFGGGYQFASRPVGPPQRSFTLKFKALKWYLGSDGFPDIYTNIEFNAGRLDAFYQENQLYNPFYYQHPTFGKLVCRFAKPLVLPAPEDGSDGVIKDVTVELIEIPK